MWLERIIEFQKENKIFIDLNYDPHQCLYVKNIIKSNYDFQLKENKIFIKDMISNKICKKETFFYWWFFKRFSEINKEEETIFNKFNTLKQKISKIKPSDENYEKLQSHLKSEADKANYHLNILKRFRYLYPNIDSLENFLKNNKLLLQCG
jgi:hypothetical protein